MPGVLRDRGQAGRVVLEGDPVHRRRPVRGFRPGGAGRRRCRVVAGAAPLPAACKSFATSAIRLERTKSPHKWQNVHSSRGCHRSLPHQTWR